jgi:site-specific recombinase XerD
MDIDGFLSALGVVNKHTRTTLAAYRRELKHFDQFLRTRRLRVSQVKPKTILDYLQIRDPKNARRPATTGRRLAVLSRFFGYIELTSNGRIRSPVTVIARPKKQPARPNPADPRVVERLLAGITSVRDRLLLRVFLATGLRLSELCSLDRDTIRAEVTELASGKRVLGVGRIIGKGQDREREFFVDLETLRAVHDYNRTRTDNSPALFTSNRRIRISTRAVDHLLRRWCRKLGLPVIHAHQLRSRFATDLDAMGVPLKEISTLLGHASPQTTIGYIRKDAARVRAAYFAAFEPRVQLKEPVETK